MNERIKELLAQATEIHDDQKSGVSHPVVDYKIFAELIVKECVEIVMEDKGITWSDSIRIAESIKDNFGVE